jgi:hypothetical protein
MVDMNDGMQELIHTDMMELKKYVGKVVYVEHSWYGHVHTDSGKLEYVDEFHNIGITGLHIPFIGYGAAILSITCDREIKDSSPGLIFCNQLIPRDYNARTPEEMEEYVRMCFGSGFADKQRKERIEREEKSKLEWLAVDDEAEKNIGTLIEEGKNLVKPELVSEWETYTMMKRKPDSHGNFAYAVGIVEGAVKVFRGLSNGMMPDKAMDETDDMGITGYMAGNIAGMVSHFHPRGDEFKLWWNLQYGISDAKGVVNPAILHIGLKDG